MKFAFESRQGGLVGSGGQLVATSWNSYRWLAKYSFLKSCGLNKSRLKYCIRSIFNTMYCCCWLSLAAAWYLSTNHSLPNQTLHTSDQTLFICLYWPYLPKLSFFKIYKFIKCNSCNTLYVLMGHLSIMKYCDLLQLYITHY